MNLYLHCGYHKTGSSFLQTLFSRNRGYLKSHGIHFPVAPREYDMVSGNISPGNGPELAKALKDEDYQKSSELMAGYISEAENNGCDAILLSSENFFHSFGNPGAVECLTEIAEKNGIESIHALVYFRDPVSHALSTYKHRAKKGTLPDYPGWLETGYETMGLIESFLNYRSIFPIRWSCRKYEADSIHLATSAFKDWLGLEAPEIPVDDRINVSLTLSEIVALQALKQSHPSSVTCLREAFSEVSADGKGKDRELNKKYRAVAAGKLRKYKSLVDSVNTLLPDNEKLTLAEPDASVDLLSAPEAVFTKEQLQAIAEAVEKSVKSEQLLNQGRAILTKITGKINRKIRAFSH